MNHPSDDDVITGQSDIPAFGSRGPKSALTTRLKPLLPHFYHTSTSKVTSILSAIACLSLNQGSPDCSPDKSYDVRSGQPPNLIQSRKSDHNYQKLSWQLEKVMFPRPPRSLFYHFLKIFGSPLTKNGLGTLNGDNPTYNCRCGRWGSTMCTSEYVTCVYTRIEHFKIEHLLRILPPKTCFSLFGQFWVNTITIFRILPDKSVLNLFLAP